MEKIDTADKYKKGIVLMTNALKKYEEGDIEGGDRDRELANHFFDKEEETDTEQALEFSEKDDVALYGENKNFGIIYNVFEENAKNILKENKNTKAIKEFVSLIKGNKILKEQFDCYNAFKNVSLKGDTEEYLSEALEMLPSLSKNEVREANNKLIKVLRKYKLDETVKINDNLIDLYESVEFLLLNTKNINNINDYNISKNVIKEHLEKCISDESETVNINEKDYTQELKLTIDKHLENLNEDEKALIAELNEGDKQNVFTKYKNETIRYICEQIDNSQELNDKIDWNNVLTKISIKPFNEHTVLEDVTSFINIQNIINE